MPATAGPTILVYGHFDVQPVDPVAEWTSPPFEPVVKDGRIYARGASDDKGNMLVPILALEALLTDHRTAAGQRQVLLRGPGGDRQSTAARRSWPRSANASPATSWSRRTAGSGARSHPELLLGMKGLAASEIHVIGPNQDLHSGIHGGGVQNPIHALVRLLDSMRAPDGTITVDGFYDAVRPLDAAERAQIARIPKDDDRYAGAAGSAWRSSASRVGPPRERQWARPTLEINGIWGGFQGAGAKTVIPREAHAKITCRLVPNQEPAGDQPSARRARATSHAARRRGAVHSAPSRRPRRTRSPPTTGRTARSPPCCARSTARSPTTRAAAAASRSARSSVARSAPTP